MTTEILGIVGNNMYLAPFYGGDHDHIFTITDYQKKDLLERGIQEFSSYDYIEAKLYDMTYEEYLDMLKSREEHSKQRELEKPTTISNNLNGLPF
jgi:hypothetical protein